LRVGNAIGNEDGTILGLIEGTAEEGKVVGV
jgi:hypothetical protein